MTAILDLRTSLTTALNGLLGTYQLANGTATPAVDVRARGEGREVGTTVSGLELVIQRDPALVPIRAQESESCFMEWTAFLVEWANPSTTAADAARVVVAAIPGCDAEIVDVPENTGPRHQVRLVIRQSTAATGTDLILPIVAVARLLREDGGFLLREDGGKLLLE